MYVELLCTNLIFYIKFNLKLIIKDEVISCTKCSIALLYILVIIKTYDFGLYSSIT